MKCWCKKIGYVCVDCEAKKKWRKVSTTDKIHLKVYKKQLSEDRVDLKLAAYLLQKGLCVSMIPEKDL